MELIKNNKGPVAVIAVIGAGVLGWLAFGYFGIQAAFIDDVVDEEGPVFTVTSDEAEAADESAADEAAPADDALAETESAVEPEPTDDAPESIAVAEEPASPAEDIPAEAVPTDDAPAEEAPVEEAAVEDAPPVEEPPAAPAEEPEEEEAQTPGEIVTIFSGQFSSLNGYSVTGDALVLNNGTEQRFLRFENFVSDNGPDLKVYLRAANGDFVSLGDLTGNIGDQNYEIPVDVDLSVFTNVEIWCERFSAGFGVATLAAA